MLVLSCMLTTFCPLSGTRYTLFLRCNASLCFSSFMGYIFASVFKVRCNILPYYSGCYVICPCVLMLLWLQQALQQLCGPTGTIRCIGPQVTTSCGNSPPLVCVAALCCVSSGCLCTAGWPAAGTSNTSSGPSRGEQHFDLRANSSEWTRHHPASIRAAGMLRASS